MGDTPRLILIFLNAFMYLAAAGFWFIVPEEKTLNFSLSILTLSMTSFLMFQNKDVVMQGKKSWQVRKITYAAFNFFLVMVILSFLNYLSFKNSAQIDVSKGEINSLTGQTIQVIKGMKSDLKVKVFARKEHATSVMSLMDLYRTHKKNIETEVIDPDSRPDKVNEFDIEKIPTVVMEYEKKREYVDEQTELAYTNALIKLSRNKKPFVYFLTGFSGMDLDRDDKEGMSLLAKILDRASFQVSQVNILSLEKIPADVDLVLIWGPKQEIPLSSLNVLHSYLKSGGRLMLALDPGIVKDPIPQTRKSVEELFGIKIPNNLIIDTKSFVSGSKGAVPIFKKFNTKHNIGRNFLDPVFFPLASSVLVTDESLSHGAFTNITFSNEAPLAWADNNPTEMISGQAIFDREDDIEGPVSPVGVWEEKITAEEAKTRKKARIVAFGNSTFVLNAHAQMGGNYRFFLKSISWLIEDDLIETFNLPLDFAKNLVIDDKKKKIVFYVSLILLPVFFAGIGFFLYQRRKRM